MSGRFCTFLPPSELSVAAKPALISPVEFDNDFLAHPDKSKQEYCGVNCSNLPPVGLCVRSLQQCLHNTDGDRCEKCLPGFYGDPLRGGLEACKPCPCPGITSDTQ